jgi:ATP/maltotriose-dependent transcriptional regulator MalT
LKGDVDGAVQAFTSALSTAEAGRALARLHGEVDLPARLEARRGALVVPREPAAAQHHFEVSALRWHAVGAWLAEARALSNLASASALAGNLDSAASHFESAASAAARGGDFLFQARALLGQSKVLKRGGAPLERVKAIAAEAWKLASAVGWAQGCADAEAVVGAANELGVQSVRASARTKGFDGWSFDRDGDRYARPGTA